MIYIDDEVSRISSPELLDELISGISRQRLEKIATLKPFKAKVQSALAFRLLETALRTEYSLNEVPEFTFNENGKPFFLSHSPIHFNLSHCDKAVVCALNSRPVGIDVETIRAYDRELAQYISSPEEFEAIENSDDPALAFIVMWTKKESLCKMTGEGLSGKETIRNLLKTTSVRFETIINRLKGYVVTYCQ